MLDLDVSGFRLDPARHPPSVDLGFLLTRQEDGFCQGSHPHQEVDLSDCVRPSPVCPGWECLVEQLKTGLKRFSAQEGVRR